MGLLLHKYRKCTAALIAVSSSTKSASNDTWRTRYHFCSHSTFTGFATRFLPLWQQAVLTRQRLFTYVIRGNRCGLLTTTHESLETCCWPLYLHVPRWQSKHSTGTPRTSIRDTSKYHNLLEPVTNVLDLMRLSMVQWSASAGCRVRIQTTLHTLH